MSEFLCLRLNSSATTNNLMINAKHRKNSFTENKLYRDTPTGVDCTNLLSLE